MNVQLFLFIEWIFIVLIKTEFSEHGKLKNHSDLNKKNSL